MTRPIVSKAGVASPCTSVCSIDAASGWCAGCLRTIDEIAAWGSLDDAGKREVWARLRARRAERRRGQENDAPPRAPGPVAP